MNVVVGHIGLHYLVDDSSVPIGRSEPISPARLLVCPATLARAVREEHREERRRESRGTTSVAVRNTSGPNRETKSLASRSQPLGCLPSATARKTCVRGSVCAARRGHRDSDRHDCIGGPNPAGSSVSSTDTTPPVSFASAFTVTAKPSPISIARPSSGQASTSRLPCLRRDATRAPRAPATLAQPHSRCPAQAPERDLQLDGTVKGDYRSGRSIAGHAVDNASQWSRACRRTANLG